MKIFFTIQCILLCAMYASAQEMERDSLFNLLKDAKTTEQKALLLNNLAHSFLTNKPDSAIIYAGQSLVLSEKIKGRQLQEESLTTIALGFSRIGNLPKALDAYFKALQIEKDLKDTNGIGKRYNDIGGTFSREGDIKKAIEYTLKAQQMLQTIGNASKNWAYLSNLSEYYFDINKMDSALIYAQRAYEISTRINDPRIYLNFLQLGSIQEAFHNNSIALSYYRQSLQSAGAKNFNGINSVYMQLAEFFEKTGIADSSIIYAKKALEKSQSVGYMNGVFTASNLLSKLYEKKDIPLAFQYYKAATAIKDSIFSIEKIKEIQNITIAQELKEQEEQEELIKAEESRKRYIQIAGISIFIPLFFFSVMLLGKLKVKPRTVEFLGILSLLFVFEFITLVIHPFLEKWTNDTPVLMLLILVGLAAFLVPMHHRIEHWMKERLVSHRHAAHAVHVLQTEPPKAVVELDDNFAIENSEEDDSVI